MFSRNSPDGLGGDQLHFGAAGKPLVARANEASGERTIATLAVGEIGCSKQRYCAAGKPSVARRTGPFRRAHDCNSNRVSRTELPSVGAFRRESAGLLWGKLGANRAGRPRSRGGKGSSGDRTICGGNRVSRTALPCCRKAFGRKAD